MKKQEKLPKFFYEENRKKFTALLDDFSAAVLFAGEAPPKTGDDDYPFTPNRNFLYLTGIEAPRIIYLCIKAPDKTMETLFIERHDEKKARWVGAGIRAEEASELSGIRNVMLLDEFGEAVTNALFRSRIDNLYLDIENRHGNYMVCSPLKYWENFSKNYPGVKLKDGGRIIRLMRGIKRDAEIEQIKEAINITKIALEHMMNSMASGMYEYQLESCFDFALKYNGVRESAFTPIIAGGKNATVLHYNANSDVLCDGELVLMDFGASWNHYSADITRTVPVNGKFTERQKELYNIVLEGQLKVLAAIKPGVTISELNNILLEHYKTALKKAGLIGRKARGAVLNGLIEKFYWHSIGHALGLDAHDCSPARNVPLEPGMVITVEPGLYVENEGIGIRIEDDILITENGCINLTDRFPKTVENIERYFIEAGLTR